MAIRVPGPLCYAAQVAEAAAHLWWRRREHRRDLANGYVRAPRDEV